MFTPYSALECKLVLDGGNNEEDHELGDQDYDAALPFCKKEG